MDVVTPLSISFRLSKNIGRSNCFLTPCAIDIYFFSAAMEYLSVKADLVISRARIQGQLPIGHFS